jgi:hypothetical protein
LDVPDYPSPKSSPARGEEKMGIKDSEEGDSCGITPSPLRGEGLGEGDVGRHTRKKM